MRKIYVVLYDDNFPSRALEAARRMGERFTHEVRFLLLDGVNKAVVALCGDVPVDDATQQTLTQVVEQEDASMLIFELNDRPKAKRVQQLLNLSRGLRVPYLFVKPSHNVDFKHVAVTVSFLEEDKEKATFASAFGRFGASGITLLTANDYGSKAVRHTEAIATLLDKFALNYACVRAQKDSFGVDAEAVHDAVAKQYSLVMLSATREYGLDDWLFGPKERRLIQTCVVPLMLINPRGDLYALCN